MASVAPTRGAGRPPSATSASLLGPLCPKTHSLVHYLAQTTSAFVCAHFQPPMRCDQKGISKGICHILHPGKRRVVARATTRRFIVLVLLFTLGVRDQRKQKIPRLEIPSWPCCELASGANLEGRREFNQLSGPWSWQTADGRSTTPQRS